MSHQQRTCADCGAILTSHGQPMRCCRCANRLRAMAPGSAALSRIDITGQRFGRYIAIELMLNKPRRWRCRCDCGQERIVPQLALRSGKSTSCGCRRAESCTRHGHNRKGRATPTWQCWASMLYRCRSPKATGYKNYGGRGITVCERWHDFRNFLADMGERPDGMSLDRWPDNNGNYEPGNCRWATEVQQKLNTRVAVPIDLGGEIVSLIEASRRIGVGREIIRRRIAEHGDPHRRYARERRRA
jgi:hypothetical protein